MIRRVARLSTAIGAAVGLLVAVAPPVLAAGPTSYEGPFSVDAVASGPSPRVDADPAAAVDPTDQNHVVVTGIQSGAGTCAAFVSHDAGRNWTAATIAMPAGFGACAGVDGGPMQPVFAGSTPVFAAQIHSGDGTSLQIVAFSSSDGGATYSAAGLIASASTTAVPAESAQQPSLAADPTVSGRLVVTYGCGGDHAGGAAEELCVAASADTGHTWASLGPLRCQLCAPATDPGTYVSWPRAAVTGAGTLIVAWRGADPAVDGQSSPAVSFSAPSPPSEPLPGAASCGTSCRLYVATFPSGALTPAHSRSLSAVSDDRDAAPALAADPKHNVAYLLWHGTGTDASGKTMEAVWFVHSQDGGTTWSSRSFRDQVLPAVLGDATGDAIFPAAAVAPGGRLDIVYVRMARASQAKTEYCYTYATQHPSAGATCAAQVMYDYSDDGGATLNAVGAVTPSPFDALAGDPHVPAATAEHGAAVAASDAGGHPVWATTSESHGDLLTDCYTYADRLCVPPSPPPASVTTAVPAGPAVASTLTLIYEHRFHLIGDGQLRLPDSPPLPARVIYQVVQPDRPPLILPIVVLAVCVPFLVTASVIGGRRGWTQLRSSLTGRIRPST
ncbi:MAG: sialidase family protein [Candidatus Dormibacteria bacterium]